MTTVSSTFTSTGQSATLALQQKGEVVTISISGTYNQTIQMEREQGSPGSGSWEVVAGPWTTANATVGETYTTIKHGERLRLNCTVDTSGTSTYSISDADYQIERRHDEYGNLLFTQTQAGRQYAGALIVDGAFTATGAVSLFSQKFNFRDDFYGTWLITDAGPADFWSSTAGSGTANEVATTVAASVNGEITLKSASDDGAHGANATLLTGVNTSWKANQGGLSIEARVKIDDITSVAFFVGFTDTISSTVELPIFKTASADTIDSDAANAVGVMFDTDGTTDEFFHGGVAANTDTDAGHSGSAPVNGTYVVVRVDVTAEGAVQGYIDGEAITGGAIASAVTVSTALTPCIAVANRSGAQRVLTVDYVEVQQDR